MTVVRYNDSIMFRHELNNVHTHTMLKVASKASLVSYKLEQSVNRRGTSQ